MEIAITTLLTLIEGLLPELGIGASNVVAKILAALISIVPIIAQSVPSLITSVKGIISALQSSGAATADQIAQLQALDAQCDAAFEAAATAAGQAAPASPATGS